MAVQNSLAKRPTKTGLTAYLTQDAVKKQINSGRRKERDTVYFQYCVCSADHAGAAGVHESEYPVSGPSGRGTEPVPLPAAGAVLHGALR